MTCRTFPDGGPAGDRPAPANGPVVVGLGNVLLGDDGVGPAVCDELLRWQSGTPSAGLPADTRLIDGGTLGSAVLPWLADAAAVVIIDAVDRPGIPGSLLVWRARNLAAVKAGAVSGVADLIAMATLVGLPEECLSLVGVIAGEIRPRVGLSTAVSAAVPRAASMVAQEIRRLTGGIG